MEPLAGTALTVGPVALGTMTFGGQVDAAEAARMIDVAREAGVVMFDTANAYVDGASEEILGELLAPIRDEVLIATKVGNRRRPPEEAGLSRSQILNAVDASLRRLRTDRIDLYYLHIPDRRVDVEVTLETMDELLQAGKIRHVGQSNYAAWEMAAMRCIAERRGFAPIRVAQTMYNLLARRIEGEYASCTQALGISSIVYNPLAGGLLTGKHRLDRGPDPGTRFGLRQLYRDRYWNDVQHRAVARFMSIADEAGMSPVELALRWAREQPVVDTILLGATSVDQLRQNLQALDGPAPDPVICKQLDEVWQELAGVAPDYWR